MIMSAAVILVTLGIAYIWASRGFFSALVHLVCTVIAGAVAFGVWEPLAVLWLGNTTDASYIGLAWGVCLALPFAIVLSLLRLGIDRLLPANTDLDSVSNLVGGGVCGLVSGTITAGIMVISISYLWLPSEFMGYRPIAFDGKGSPRRESSLIYPADRITGAIYSWLSDGAFSTSTPLAAWRPGVVDSGAMMRMSFNDGGARHTLTPSAFVVVGRYQVEGPTGKELLSDTFAPDLTQTALDLDGTPIQGGLIEGFVVNFRAAARDKGGSTIVGNAQIQLVCRDSSDTESITLTPISMISQAEGSSPDLGRWRFDSGGSGTFIRSAGAGADTPMAFEFLVPRGYTPLALYVKGVREDVSEMVVSQKYTSIEARDGAIRTGNIIAGAALGPTGELDSSQALSVSLNLASPDNDVVLGARFPGRFVLDKGNLMGVEIDDSNRVTNADNKFLPNDLNNNYSLGRALRVVEYSTSEDTKILQVRVDQNSRLGMLSPAAASADLTQPPLLFDTNGTRYAAVGYFYDDNQEVHIRYMPGQPIRAASELPSLSKSRPDQHLILLFRVSDGVSIDKFTIGNKVVGIFKPPLKMQN
ncbi:MAG: CvpA family protein [Phycisphaeraceae bacterium]|nr:CvpA family protein [Phycisphaeraceae bacterium]